MAPSFPVPGMKAPKQKQATKPPPAPSLTKEHFMWEEAAPARCGAELK